ncbi:MAG: VTT domain-containing protein [Bacilli bacterium]|nr:VTT domain-containing protein [Bacilli bacterium]
MVDMIDSFVQLITSYLQQFGVPFGILLIISESIIPALPLGVFIAFNMMAFGSVKGFILSWIATCIGCYLSYFFFSKLFSKMLLKNTKKREKLDRVVKKMQNIGFSKLVLIIALPFTPAFLVNIACGLVRVNLKKFMTAILIGKLSIVYFWGFVGKSMLESISDLGTIIVLCLLLFISYLISKIVSKKLEIE